MLKQVFRCRSSSPGVRRLRRLLGNRDWIGTHDGVPYPGQFSVAVWRSRFRRLLDALAHFAFELAAGLRLFLNRRTAAEALEFVPQPSDYDADCRLMARG